MCKRKYKKIKTLLWLMIVTVFLVPSGTVSALNSGALPTGGEITYGKGSISVIGRQMTVKQNTEKLIANWDTFNIGKNAGVTFRQPGSDATALNRIYDQNPSQILGSLSANGKIYLINPSGIVFGKSAQVNVGSLVASSLNMSDRDFLNGNYKFASNGKAGDIINQGKISVIPGGLAALIGPSVINEGTITAAQGDVLLAAGDQVTLNFNRNDLISYTVDKGAIDALAENSGLIKADGGQVILTARAADTLTSAVVNNTGIIEAQTFKQKAGRILLMSDMENGQTLVDGTLDASAPNGGNGGFIETSAANLQVNDTAIITTLAKKGETGTWLIDPYDFTIAASGGDITGAAVTTALANTNVTIQTTNTGVTCTNLAGCGTGNSAGNGDIFVNDNITWTKNILTLNAYRDIVINEELFGSDTAKLVLYYGQSTAGTYTINAPVNLPAGINGATFVTRLGTKAGNAINWTVITTPGAAGSTTGADLQGMQGNLSSSYALGTNIDASATSGWNNGAGFQPIGNSQQNDFMGNFDGLGHTISNLYINRPSENYVGLFGATNQNADKTFVQNVGLVGGSITGGSYVGALAGYAGNSNKDTITNVYSTASVTGTGATGRIGGLVGNNKSTITNAYATGNVTGTSNVGGLIGYNEKGPISYIYATGNVSGTTGVGGLVGYNANSITYAYATGNVSGTTNVGGLAGYNGNVAISNAYSTGTVSGTTNVGAFVGNNAGTVSASHWDTTIAGATGVGLNTNTFNATGLATADMMDSLKFTGWNFTDIWWLSPGNTRPFLRSEYGPYIVNAHELQLMALNLGAKYTLGANISMSELSNASGLWNTSTGFVPIGSSTTPFTGTFNGQGKTITNLAINRPATDYVGLFGYIGSAGNVNNAGLAGGSVSGANYVGGLAGYNAGTVSNTSSTVNVNGSNEVGGLIGYNDGTVTNSHYNIDSVLINSARHVTLGGLYGVQYTDWINNGKTLNIANYSSSLPLIGGYYQISSAQGLKDMLGFVDVSGYKFRLNSDINLADVKDATGTTSDWHIPVFSATEFDGNGHTLSNLNLGLPNSKVGFIGTLSSGSTLKNIGLRDITVTGRNDVGGLVGNNDGSISISYVTGNVGGTDYVGGLVGKNNTGTINNSYASDNVSGVNYVGGLAGDNASGSISNTYATGSVSGTTSVGGLVGSNAGTVNSSYWDIETTGQSSSAGGTGLTTAEMMTMSSFSGWNIANTGGTGEIWRIYEDYTYPLLRNFLVPVTITPAFNGGGVYTDIAAYTTNVTGFDPGKVNTTPLTLLISSTATPGEATAALQGNFWSFQNGYDITTATRTLTGTGSNANDLRIGQEISWSSNHLILNAANNIVIDSTMDGSGTAQLSLQYGQGAVAAGNTATYNVNAPVNLPKGENFFTKLGSDGLTKTYYVITELGDVGSTTATDLQGMNGNLTRNYALGGNINAAATSGWNGGAGFAPIGNGTTTFTGTFEGLGHTISNLYINRPTQNFVGLFGYIGNVSNVSNVGLEDSSVSGSYYIGGLAGVNFGMVVNSHATGSIGSTSSNYVGGLVGFNSGKIGNSYATGNVNGGYYVGGLSGWNTNSIKDSYAAGSVNGINYVGGLVAANSGTIENSYATGNTGGSYYVGGLVGLNASTVKNSYSTGSVIGTVLVGGLLGFNSGAVSNTYATGNVNGDTYVGGLVAFNNGTIGNSYATGNVNGGYYVGGLSGWNTNSIKDSYAAGSVNGINYVGGLVAANSGTIENSYATGNTGGSYYVGGLVGLNASTVKNSYSTGSVIGTVLVGGLLGFNSGAVSNTYATGSINGNYYVGGLVAFNSGTVENSYATGNLNGMFYIGGLIGYGSGNVTYSFWDAETTGQIVSAGGIGKTTAEMQTATTFTNVGWSTAIWDIVNGSYPTLQ